MEHSSSLRGQLFILRTMQFTNYATMVLLVTYFPLYFESLGYTKLQIGAIYSVGPFLSIISNLAVGVISDRTKNLRRILSLLFCVQILALALLLPQKEFGIMAGIMALFYLFQTPVNSMMDSVSLLAADQMKRSFPSIRMFGSLGYAVCAVLFGYLLKVFGSDLTITLAIIVIGISFVFSFFIGNYQATLRKFEFSGLWGLLRKKETVTFFLLIMVVSIAHRMNEGFLSIAMREIGADDSVIGYASLASAVSEIPMFFLLAKFGHRFRELPLLALASFIYVIRLGLLSYASEPWMMVALQTMHSVTFAIFYITALRCLQALIPDEYRSSGQAVFAVVWSGLAGLVAGTLGGWMYDSMGLAYVFRTGAIFALVGAFGFLFVHLRRSQ
ncbi:MFS transporter [Cohnella mopanensis]|uniref:MFS transporter n=1 Tax=Cohnella mopanensis TaxID=2911966 RepID=UPI001EF954EA|nr:MFS transporter [Cohnella mopanensis]